MEIKNDDIIDSMGTSLQNMLTLNQTIEYLEIECDVRMKYVAIISSVHLSFLITGLSHNTNLQQLSVFVPLSDTNNEQIRTFFNVISQKNYLTELKLDFKLPSYSGYRHDHMKYASLFYEQVLPLVTNMLESHTTIRLLKIECSYVGVVSSQPNWIELIQHFLQTIFLHPTLQYIEIVESDLLMDTQKSHEKRLVGLHRKQHLLKPLPIIKFIHFSI